jgi:hypothetical protein
MRKTATYLLFLFITYVLETNAQELVAKLKPQYKDYLGQKGIVNNRFNSLFAAMKIKEAKKLLRLKELKPTPLDNVLEIHLQQKEYEPQVLQALMQSGYFEYVVSVGGGDIEAMHLPNDPFAQPNTPDNQFYLQKINAYKAWDITKGDTNVVTCVIDNGVEWTHPELASKIKYNQGDHIDGVDNDQDGFTDNYIGWDMANFDPYPEDSTGAVAHGTEVSSVGFALTDNNLGMASIGYNCKFVPIKIFKNGFTNPYTSSNGIIYAANHGCKVINLSWGQLGGFSQFGQDVINYAALVHDAVVVGATFALDGDNLFTSPADYDNVLSVLGLHSTDVKATPQAYHYWIDMSVPSIDMRTADLRAGFKYTSGISVGLPLVSGAAALVRGKYPWMNSTQVSELLRVTGTNIDTAKTYWMDNSNYKEKLGHGRLDVYKALTDTTTPAVRILQYNLKQINGDTISMELGFKNYLWPSQNLVFDFRSITGGFVAVDSSTTAGVVNMMDSASTAFAGIRLYIPTHAPADSIDLVRIGISDTATGYTDYQYFYLNKNAVSPLVVTKTKNSFDEENGSKIYPNPCAEKLFLELDEAEEVTITDIAGKKLFYQSSPSDLVVVETKDFESGLYFAQIQGKSGTHTHKFLKK